MRIQFNTGRGYSATGQPITAVYNYSNVVMFRDHARGITGTIPVALGMRLDTAGLREFAWRRGGDLRRTHEATLN